MNLNPKETETCAVGRTRWNRCNRDRESAFGVGMFCEPVEYFMSETISGQDNNSVEF